MKCVHTEKYKNCSIKIYMDSYHYYAKTKLLNEARHYYIGDYIHDLKVEAIKSAKEEINVMENDSDPFKDFQENNQDAHLEEVV